MRPKGGLGRLRRETLHFFDSASQLFFHSRTRLKIHPLFNNEGAKKASQEMEPSHRPIPSLGHSPQFLQPNRSTLIVFWEGPGLTEHLQFSPGVPLIVPSQAGGLEGAALCAVARAYYCPQPCRAAQRPALLLRQPRPRASSQKLHYLLGGQQDTYE